MKKDNNEILGQNKLKFDVAYFYGLDSENRICFDCGGAFPSCVSINNGVFLCKFCGENHRKKLNYNISFIREINDDWDQYLLSYATRGGNSRFKRLCLQYEIPCQSLTQNDDEKINKYLIRLGEYIRLLLKSEINCDEPPPALYKEVANDPINQNTIYFPEFENYTLFKGNFTAKGNDNKNFTNNQTNTDDTPSTSTGAKIWEGTKTTFNIMKTTTGVIYNTGKPIVSFLGNTAFNGLKYVGSSVWNYYMNNNETNNGEGNGEGNNSQKNQTDNGNNNNIKMQQKQNPDYNNLNNQANYNNNFDNNNKNYFNNNSNTKFDYNINNNNYINFNNNNNNNNIYNNNYNNSINYNIQNKNNLTNSNKYNIFTINDNGISNNNNNTNNIFSKPMKSKPQILEKDNNNIPNYYDINSINNESVNNITFYLNNNNSSINNSSKTGRKNSILNHDNIIVNNKYINEKNFLIYNDKKENNVLKNDNMNNINRNEKDISLMNTPGYASKLNISRPNNVYPNYSSIFNNNENNISNNDIIMNREIIDKNIPNIIGEEMNQEKARYPIFQSTNLLDNNSFLPSEVGNDKNYYKKEKDNPYLNTPNN